MDALKMAELEDRQFSMWMIEEKARSLLSRSERHLLTRTCNLYASHQLTIDHFVDSLVQLLNTPDKMTFLVELRELIDCGDRDRYDDRVYRLVNKKPIIQMVQPQTANQFDFQKDAHSQCILQVKNTSGQSKPSEKPNGRRGRRSGGEPQAGIISETLITLLPDLRSAFPAIPSLQKSGNAAETSRASIADPKQHSSPKKKANTIFNRIVTDETEELLTVSVAKTKAHLGIAIEGGANTRHPLPRIINIDANGAAFEAAGLKVGQTIVEVNGTLMEGEKRSLPHDEAARRIAEAFADKTSPELRITATANSFRPNADLYRPNS